MINTRQTRTMSIECSVISLNPALWWIGFGIIRPELIHDACWDGES